jgi:hypothetical protein
MVANPHQFGFIHMTGCARPLDRPLASPHDEVMLLARQLFNAPFAQLVWLGRE